MNDIVFRSILSERMAERIKINVGAALTELGEDAPEDYIVHGPNRITARCV